MEIINPEGPVRLKRSRSQNMIAGVCGGLGKYFEVDPTVVRLVFVLAAFVSVGILAYIVMWIIVPYEEY
ncbi:MAG TPA: PspC domain-containing protein [Prolixibacteraceae bacterium]